MTKSIAKYMYICYNVAMKSTKRHVKNSYQSSIKLSSNSYSKTEKARIRSRERFQRLALTQARRYLLYALGCFLSVQLIKFVLYSILFRGDSSPTGTWFLMVVYLQTALLLMTFIFVILAVFKTLQRLLTEEF